MSYQETVDGLTSDEYASRIATHVDDVVLGIESSSRNKLIEEKQRKRRLRNYIKTFPFLLWLCDKLAKLNGVANALQTAGAVLVLFGPSAFPWALLVFFATMYWNYTIPKPSMEEMGVRVHDSIWGQTVEHYSAETLTTGLGFWGKCALWGSAVTAVVTGALYWALTFKGAGDIGATIDTFSGVALTTVFANIIGNCFLVFGLLYGVKKFLEALQDKEHRLSLLIKALLSFIVGTGVYALFKNGMIATALTGLGVTASVSVGSVLASVVALICLWKGWSALKHIIYSNYISYDLKRNRDFYVKLSVQERNSYLDIAGSRPKGLLSWLKVIFYTGIFLSLGSGALIVAANGLAESWVIAAGTTVIGVTAEGTPNVIPVVVAILGGVFGAVAMVCLSALMLKATYDLLIVENKMDAIKEFFRNVFVEHEYYKHHLNEGIEGFKPARSDKVKYWLTVFFLPLIIIASCGLGLGVTIYTCQLSIQAALGLSTTAAWFLSAMAFFSNVPFVVQSTVKAGIVLVKGIVSTVVDLLYGSKDKSKTVFQAFIYLIVALATVVFLTLLNATGNMFITLQSHISNDVVRIAAAVGSWFMSFSATFFNEEGPVEGIANDVLGWKGWSECCVTPQPGSHYREDNDDLLSIAVTKDKNVGSGSDAHEFASTYRTATNGLGGAGSHAGQDDSDELQHPIHQQAGKSNVPGAYFASLLENDALPSDAVVNSNHQERAPSPFN